MWVMRAGLHLHPGEQRNSGAAQERNWEGLSLACNVVVSEFFRSGRYDLHFKSTDDSSGYITSDQWADLCKSFIREYPVVSTEDPFDQIDWEAGRSARLGRHPHG